MEHDSNTIITESKANMFHGFTKKAGDFPAFRFLAPKRGFYCLILEQASGLNKVCDFELARILQIGKSTPHIDQVPVASGP